MITSSFNYYTQKLGCLFIASIFSLITIPWILNKYWVSEYVDGQQVATSINTMYPFIIGTIVFDLLFLWIALKYFRVSVDQDGITILKIGRNKNYSWDEIMYVSNVNIWKGSIFKIHSIYGNFYIHADSPSMDFKDLLNPEFKTEMGKFFKEKKILS